MLTTPVPAHSHLSSAAQRQRGLHIAEGLDWVREWATRWEPKFAPSVAPAATWSSGLVFLSVRRAAVSKRPGVAPRLFGCRKWSWQMHRPHGQARPVQCLHLPLDQYVRCGCGGLHRQYLMRFFPVRICRARFQWKSWAWSGKLGRRWTGEFDARNARRGGIGVK
jgi:hypothetical protein